MLIPLDVIIGLLWVESHPFKSCLSCLYSISTFGAYGPVLRNLLYGHEFKKNTDKAILSLMIFQRIVLSSQKR